MTKLKHFHFNNTHHRKTDKNYPSNTVAVSMPTADQVEFLIDVFRIANSTTHNIGFGMTKLHPEDQYVKLEGRQQAEKNMKYYDLKVESVRITAECIRVKLEDLLGFQIILTLNKKTKYASVLVTQLINR